MRTKLALLACAGLVANHTAHAQDATVFNPSSAWAADYGDDYCRLVRSFSDGKDEITLVIQRVQPGVDTQLMLIGNAIRTFRGATEIEWSFLPNDAARKSMFARSETGNGQQYLRIDNVFLAPFTPPPPGTPPGPPRYDRAAETVATSNFTSVQFTGGLTKPVRIATGKLDAPVVALQACADDLLSSWGLDAEKHKALSSPVIPQFSPDGWLPTGTIPFGEFSKFAGGGNQVRLMLDAQGKPTGCHIHSPTLSKTLNDRICNILIEKASFTPPTDANGQTFASYWMGSPLFLGPPMGGPRR